MWELVLSGRPLRRQSSRIEGTLCLTCLCEHLCPRLLQWQMMSPSWLQGRLVCWLGTMNRSLGCREVSLRRRLLRWLGGKLRSRSNLMTLTLPLPRRPMLLYPRLGNLGQDHPHPGKPLLGDPRLGKLKLLRPLVRHGRLQNSRSHPPNPPPPVPRPLRHLLPLRPPSSTLWL